MNRESTITLLTLSTVTGVIAFALTAATGTGAAGAYGFAFLGLSPSHLPALAGHSRAYLEGATPSFKTLQRKSPSDSTRSSTRATLVKYAEDGLFA